MYFGLFQNEQDVCKEFDIASIDGNVMFAAYEYEDYSGSADVILVSNGKLYHVEGSHCSCYGLEDQWAPVEMTIEALRHMTENGFGQLRSCRDTVLIVLDEIDRAGILSG